MFLVDTHTHLYLDAFDSDRDAVIAEAVGTGVSRFLLPNIDRDSIDPMHRLEEAFPGTCHAMMGLHPTSVGTSFRDELAIMREWIDRRDYIAIGEIGIDLYWDKSFLAQQQEAFDIQLGWACEKDIPVAIHMRDSYDEIMEVIGSRPRPGLRGVFHCFTGDASQALEVTGAGFLLGIGGVLTFRNSGLSEALREIPRELIVLETDAPFLAPVPHRGKRNDPRYLPLVATRLAELWGTDTAGAARITTGNACELFGLPNPYDHA